MKNWSRKNCYTPAVRESVGKIPDISLLLAMQVRFFPHEAAAANCGKSQPSRGPRNRLPVENSQQSEAVLAKPANVTKENRVTTRVL